MMEEADARLAYVADKLSTEAVQEIWARFAELSGFPLILVNPIVAPSARLAGQVEACGVQDAIAAPVYFKDDIIGYMAILNAPSAEWKQAELRKIAELAAKVMSEKVGTEYELDNLSEELLEKFNEVNLIYDISEALGAVLDPQTVCNIIIEKAVGVIGVEKASILLYDEKSANLHMIADYGLELSEEERREIRVAPGEGVSGTVFVSGRHMLIEDSENTIFPDLPHLDRGYKGKSFVSIPMRYKRKSFLSVPMLFKAMNLEKKVMGVINMTDKQSSDMFTAGDLRLLSSIASQAAVTLYNIRLIEEVKDAERVKREMEIAQQIQMGLLPGKPPELPGIELAGRCLPATQVGGDYYDFFPDAGQKLGLVIADVSGHNVGAALVMAAARSTLRSEVFARKAPAKILEDVNFALHADLTRAEMFITMFYAEYDGATRLLRYANGGQNRPIVLRAGKCILLDTEGMLLGVLDAGFFEEKTLLLAPNDFVIFYTDGVVEAKNEHDDMFTLERLCHVLETAERQSHADELLERIYAEVEQYSGQVLRSDDITVMILKIHCSEEGETNDAKNLSGG